MGQAESSFSKEKVDEQFEQRLTQQYNLYKSNYNDARLNQIEVYEHKHNQDEYVGLKLYNCTSEHQYRQMLCHIDRMKQLVHKNVVQILATQQSKEQMCGTLKKLKVYYEYYGTDLKMELEQRSRSDQQLLETEIWYILDSLVEALYYLKQHGVNINCLRIDHVMLSNDGLIKLMVQQNQKGLNRLFGIDTQYMSPEQIQQFNSNDQISNDVTYSLAIIIVYCCTLQDPIDSIYNTAENNQVKFNYEQLQRMLNDIKQKYSHQFLGNLLEKMLSKQKNARFDIQMVNSILIPYRTQIQKMQNFTQQLDEKEKGSYEIVHTKSSKGQSDNKYKQEFQHIFDQKRQTSSDRKVSHFKFGSKQVQSNTKLNHSIEFKNISMANSYYSDNYSQFIDKKYVHKYHDIFQNNDVQQQQQDFPNQMEQMEFSSHRFQNDLDQMIRINFSKNNDDLGMMQFNKSTTCQPSNKLESKVTQQQSKQMIYQKSNTNSHFQSQQSNINQSVPNSKLTFNSSRQQNSQQSWSLQKKDVNSRLFISNIHK